MTRHHRVSPTRFNDMQRQIWSGYLRYPNLPLHNLAVTFDLEKVDIRRLRRALVDTLAADPSLRVVVDGNRRRPRLAVSAGRRPQDIEIVDAGASGDARLAEDVALRAGRAFDLSRELLRNVLYDRGAGRVTWLLVAHHIAFDGWSVKVLVERVARAYLRGADGVGSRSTAMPHLSGRDGSVPVPRNHRNGAHTAVAERARRRSGASGAGSLKTPERLFQPPRPGSQPSFERFRLPDIERRSARLLAAAHAAPGRTEKVRLLNIAAALFGAFLSRISEIHRLSMGLPFSNRSVHNANEIGLHMRVARLWVEVDGSETPRELAGRIAAGTAAAARTVRRAPVDHEPAPSDASSPLDALLNVHNISYPAIGAAPPRERWLRSGNDAVPVTLHLRTSRADGVVEIELDLSTAHFLDDDRDGMYDQFTVFFDAFLEHLDAPIGTLPLFDAQSVASFYRTVNGAHRPFPAGRLETMFRAVAEANGGRPAVVGSGGVLATFAEIEERSDALAAAIAGSGARRGDRIAVVMERSVAAVVAVIATLKAGCVWVPVDPTYPKARRDFMLADSHASCIVTGRDSTASDAEAARPTYRLSPDGRLHFAARERIREGDDDGKRSVEAIPAGAVVSGGTSRPGTAAGSDALSRPLDADGPAFCLYTSGSTGEPKGVYGTHAGVVNRLVWMWREVPFDPDEVVLHKTSLSFIDSVWEIFGALLHGRPICVASDAECADPRRLGRLAAQFPVRRIILVPSLLLSLCRDTSFAGAFSAVRHWFVTGEALHRDVVEALRSRLPDATVYNLYGTSETYDAACAKVDAHDLVAGWIPIGRPIDNMRLFVLDDALRPLGPGRRGQLAVAGPGTSPGYHERPQLTEQRFPEISVAPGVRVRCFLTGDLAVVRRNGVFVCMGRIDHLVKIRGYRVEPEEVEHVLERHRSVERAAVVAIGDGPAARLVAVVVPRGFSGVSTAELHRFARRQLPEWMMPEIRIVTAPPLTPSGKLDRESVRRAIEADDRTTVMPPRAGTDDWRTMFEAPGVSSAAGPPEIISHAALRVARVWRKALGVGRLALTDDFFRFGGTSLSAVEAVAGVERTFGTALSLSSIFASPTPLSFARDQLMVQATTDSGAVLLGGNEEGPTAIFAVPPAGSTVSAFHALAERTDPEIPFYAFQPLGMEAGEPILRTVESIAADFVRKLRARRPNGPYVLVGRCFGGYVAYEMAQQLMRSGDRVEALVIIDSREAPLAPEEQRMHVGLRRLVEYYPGRVAYFLRRKMLFYVVRMKLKNLGAYILASTLGRLSLRTRDRRRTLSLLRYVHTMAYHRYVAAPYDGPLMMIWAEAQGDHRDDEARWRNLSSGGISWNTVACRHTELLREPFVAEVADVIDACATGNPVHDG